MFHNTIVIENIYNYSFDFKKLLKKTDTIIWKNCENINIKISSKINKVIFNNCKNIKINIFDTICGIEIYKTQIKVNLKNSNLNFIETYKSNIYLTNYTNLPTIINEDSKIIKK
ncbi:hypothetical protein [Chlorella virus XW01]|nr:hypothetical protein [Chlorella virus XW01]